MNRLKELRLDRGISLRELANALEINYGKKISRASLSNYENGDTEPKNETWDILADYYHVDSSYLRGLNPIKNPMDNMIYEQSVSTMVDLVQQNSVASSQIKEIIENLGFYLSHLRDSPDLASDLSEIIRNLSAITPYPNNDSLSINNETGELFSIKESVQFILKKKKNLQQKIDLFVDQAIANLTPPDIPIIVSEKGDLLIDINAIDDPDIKSQIAKQVKNSSPNEESSKEKDHHMSDMEIKNWDKRKAELQQHIINNLKKIDHSKNNDN
ncbi:helix-turn-helix domain-containing protein [Lactiplantibacillus plantarum]|uniref:helix-turn-helix domain-containing protein n=1 Tax=Lactiplantibacillus plantarum TaxID=1590 RepID=UPI0009784234|nr:helix-turn-helix transcriptional regulator [Lactiplantibacillus plantarum]